MKKWWEKEPLRFECQPDCFKCCAKPGIVHFDREDIRQAAAYLDFSIAEFKKTFLIRSDGEWVLEVGENGAPCTFLTDQGCGIHKVKPKQCLLTLSGVRIWTLKTCGNSLVGFVPVSILGL